MGVFFVIGDKMKVTPEFALHAKKILKKQVNTTYSKEHAENNENIQHIDKSSLQSYYEPEDTSNNQPDFVKQHGRAVKDTEELKKELHRASRNAVIDEVLEVFRIDEVISLCEPKFTDAIKQLYEKIKALKTNELKPTLSSEQEKI